MVLLGLHLSILGVLKLEYRHAFSLLDDLMTRGIQEPRYGYGYGYDYGTKVLDWLPGILTSHEYKKGLCFWRCSHDHHPDM